MNEVNDESRGNYNKDNQIRFKISMLSLSLCDYSDAYILVKGTLTVTSTAAQFQPNNGAYKKVTFQNFVPLTNCISRINNTRVDDAHNIDVVMRMYNIITTHLVSHLSLSSIVIIISTLLMGIFYCLNYTLLFLHLIILHLVNIFYNNHVINICPRQYYNL